MSLKRVSASQVKDYNSCGRKWYFIHVLKEPKPQTEALRIGIEVHDAAEKYLKTGKIPEGPWSEHIALAAPHLPPPMSPAVQVEAWIEIKTGKGLPPWVGKVDVMDLRDPIIHVLDHKTEKEAKYRLTQETLATDVQMNAYGYYALTHPAYASKSREGVKYTHNYIRVQGKPKVEPVSAFVPLARVKESWQKSLETVSEMVKTAEQTAWKDVTPNTTACSAYGGCPFRERCGFTNEIEILKGIKKMSTNLLDRLRAKQQPTAEEAPAAAVAESIVPPDAPSRESTVEEVAEVSEPVKKSKAKKAAPAPAPKAETPPTQAKQEVATDEATDSDGFTLYVDCYPVHGAEKPTLFESIIAPILAQAAEENGVADIRFVKYEAKPRLAQALKAAIDSFPREIVVSSMATHADTFLEVVAPKAKLIVAAIKGMI
jgi:CRISPR/Cas system-associated exonuclease Cas4 (RecB family)